MIDISQHTAAERRMIAERALATTKDPRAHVLVHVRCGRGHHVAAVFDTMAGPVYRASTGSHAHGSRDFVDEAHCAHRRGDGYVDLLAPDELVDDGLPASCECGPYMLSRTRLQTAVERHEHRVQLA